MTGNLWDFRRSHKIVISTNIGWHPESYRNNMGAGIALQCARRYPGIDDWYGQVCRWIGATTPVIEREELGATLIFFR